MPDYARCNPHLQQVWNAKIRKINRMFKAIEQEGAHRVRLQERRTA